MPGAVGAGSWFDRYYRSNRAANYSGDTTFRSNRLILAVVSFILQVDIGFGLKDTVANWTGIVSAIFALYIINRLSRRQHRVAEQSF